MFAPLSPHIITEHAPTNKQIVLYVCINAFAVRYYGETEFWLSLGKVLLATGLIFYAFITMVGGNPLHDVYGFRFWNNPGAFAEYWSVGSLGRFQGFLACLIQACYTVVGPDYIAMTAGEAENPRRTMPRAYKGMIYRLAVFFMGGALSMGIVCAYNDPELLAAIEADAGGAAASPYIVSMQRLKIPVLPHIVNALILSSAFSAGNSYTYCASRTLYGMALDGFAPKIFAKCTANGVPVYATAFTLCFGLLAFLQLGNTAQTVLNWIVSIGTASELINFAIISAVYLRFYYALRAQGISRDTLPYKGILQPFSGWLGLIACSFMTLVSGYTVFLKGNWSISSFIFSYVMIAVDIVAFIAWTLLKRPKIPKLEEIDLTTGLKEIADYEANYVEAPPKNKFDKALRYVLN